MRLLVIQPPVATSPIAFERVLADASARELSTARRTWAADAAALVRAGVHDTDDTDAARTLVASASAYRRAYMDMMRARFFDGSRARAVCTTPVRFTYELALFRDTPVVPIADTSFVLEGVAITYSLIAALQRRAATSEPQAAARFVLNAVALTHWLESQWLPSFAPTKPASPSLEHRECVLGSPLLLETVRDALIGHYYALIDAPTPALLLAAAAAFTRAHERARSVRALDQCTRRLSARAYLALARTLLATPALPEWAAGVAVACAREAVAATAYDADEAAPFVAAAAEIDMENIAHGSHTPPTTLDIDFGDALALARTSMACVRITVPHDARTRLAWDADAVAARLALNAE